MICFCYSSKKTTTAFAPIIEESDFRHCINRHRRFKLVADFNKCFNQSGSHRGQRRTGQTCMVPASNANLIYRCYSCVQLSWPWEGLYGGLYMPPKIRHLLKACYNTKHPELEGTQFSMFTRASGRAVHRIT